MAQVSKNSRTSSTTHHFYCPCGGEVKMKTLFEDGRVKNVAECEKCKRTERRPSDFTQSSGFSNTTGSYFQPASVFIGRNS